MSGDGDSVRSDVNVSQLLAACLLGGSAGWSLTAVGAEGSSLAAAYHVNLAEVGLLTSVFSLTYAVSQIPAGLVIDRIGRRRAGLWGLGLVAVPYAVAAVAPLGSLAALCRAFAGIGAALCYVAGAEAARSSGAGALGQGIFGGAAAAAGGAALILVPLSSYAVDWRSPWLTSSVLALAGIASVLLHVPSRSDGRDGGTASARPAPRDRNPVLRDGELYRLAAVHAVTFGGSVVLSNWAAMILKSVWGMSDTFATVSASFILLTTIVSRPLGGYLARNWTGAMRGLTVGSLLIGALCVFLLGHAAPQAVAPILCLVVGVTSGIPFAWVFASAQRRRGDRPAGAIGLINAHANLIIVVGTPLVGSAVADGYSGAAVAVSAALWLIPLLCLPTRISDRGHRRTRLPEDIPAAENADCPVPPTRRS
ncbi:MFS transporter [Streptomyces sp. DW26H14]|uniref:MFS transporter n=1 Tax=Streptomyces sp. DW26H14 TaxID=3435395 RepID=UPI00403D8332